MLPIVVIGAGPAGLIAAGRAAECGAPVKLIEKNRQPGRKLLITGAGRCNITSNASRESFIDQFFGQGRFLYAAIQSLYREELLDLLAQHGVRCQVDHQGKFFPVSNQAGDVLAAMLRYGKENGVQLITDSTVQAISFEDHHFEVATSQGNLKACAVILTTGGLTYPVTGSTGDGYRLAEQLGHTIVTPRPALVPLVIQEAYLRDLAGLSLPNVTARLIHQKGQKPVIQHGDLLITHKGVSGPVILRLSRDYSRPCQLVINLHPTMNPDHLTAAILERFATHGRQQIKNCLDDFLPHRLAESLLTQAGIPVDRMAAQSGRRLAEQITKALQNWTLTVTGTQGVRIAMVTAGGVSLREVNPATMESKLIPGLFFAGEILNLDGDTGGYNLQAACSTGYLAGLSAASHVLGDRRNH